MESRIWEEISIFLLEFIFNHIILKIEKAASGSLFYFNFFFNYLLE